MGWEPAFFSEIEAFPRAVLEHHYPEVPLHGDFTTIKEHQYGKIDLLVGGTPCQSFSVAGLRGGLDDDRGNLALEFCRLAQREQPRWIVWENVPGVLSSGGGRDFGSILGALEDLGYGLAYRVLDAQYFGVAQRRRRVFVVGYLGDWRPAAAVLFEHHSMSGHPAPSREARQGAARAAAAGAGGSGGRRERPCVGTYECVGGDGQIVGALAAQPGTKQTTYVAYPIDTHRIFEGSRAIAGALTSNYGKQPDSSDTALGPTLAVAFGVSESPELGHCLRAGASRADKHESTTYIAASAVRRLTPVECERLQGFPDNFTAIPWRKKPADECPDGPRYKALGNSMAVPCMRWIGERIQLVDDFISLF